MSTLKTLLNNLAAVIVTAAIFVTGIFTFAPVVNAQKQAASAIAAPFTPNNLVVYRVGNGTETLTNTGNTVFLDEFTTAGSLVQSLSLPTTVSGSNRQLIASGTATSEGLLTRSTDNRYLIVPGYARDLNGTGSITGTTAADVPRTIGRIDANGVIDTSTAISDAFSANNVRSAVSTNGTDFWASGGVSGVRYFTLGSTTSTSVSTTVTNLRQINIFGGQLYVSTDSATGAQQVVAAIGTGTPTTSGQTAIGLNGLPLAGATDPADVYAFYFADLSSAVAGVDTLYLADAGVGLRKFSLVGGIWTANGSIGAAADAYRGLTATVAGTTVTLYATRKGGGGTAGGGELVSLVDATGYNATISGDPILLATAAAGTAFRGVALAPAGGTVMPPTARVRFDYDGDGRADIAVFRPSNGFWYRLGSTTGATTGVQFGQNNDLIAPADYDGDGRTDLAVFRPSNGIWYRTLSSNQTVLATQFGQSGDVPAAADYDGDARADLAVFRPSTGTWYILNSTTSAQTGVQFGQAGDRAQVGDFDGDGRSDLAVFRPSNGTWYINRSTAGFTSQQFGLSSDVADPADYDGDGRADLTVFRPSNGIWYRLSSMGGATVATQFGQSGDVAAAADYDGDGRSDLAVFRPSSGIWYVQRSTQGFQSQQFGQSGDTPTPAAYGQQ